MELVQEKAIEKIDEEFERHHNEDQYHFMSKELLDCDTRGSDG